MKALALVGVTVVLAHLPSVAAAQSPRELAGLEGRCHGGRQPDVAETMTSSGNVVADGPSSRRPASSCRACIRFDLVTCPSSAFVIPGIQPLTDITHQPGILGTLAWHDRRSHHRLAHTEVRHRSHAV